MAVTPYSSLYPWLKLGLGTSDHAVPSQCSVRVPGVEIGRYSAPTAQTSLGATAATADR
jgi:hypothetical protein